MLPSHPTLAFWNTLQVSQSLINLAAISSTPQALVSINSAAVGEFLQGSLFKSTEHELLDLSALQFEYFK